MSFEKACDNWLDRELPIPFHIERAAADSQQHRSKGCRLSSPGSLRGLMTRAFGKFLRGDYTSMETNDLWVSDGQATQSLCPRTRQRDSLGLSSVLVHWMDVRSRMIIGWKIVAGSENSDVILAAFKTGVKSHGRPVAVFHDNGDAYDAEQLQVASLNTQRRKGTYQATEDRPGRLPAHRSGRQTFVALQREI